MNHRFRARLLALPLALTLLLPPAAQALTLDQARELLQEHYIDQVPETVLEQPTIQAMIEALGDPYTEYFTAEEYGQFTDSMSDTQIVGLGVSSTVTEEGALIERVYEDTPAADGGLQAGDLIVAVDGQSVVGVTAEELTGLLQGEEGTQVSVTYLRDGESHTVTLTRRAITIPATYTELWDGHIGYIDCDTFGDETAGHFLDGIETYAEQVDRWIVDLRLNSGGSISAAMGAVSCFTGGGVLAYLKDSTGAYGAYGTNDSAQTLYPVIVLTDPSTASASELFSSDVRDTNAGIVVGGRTYGKGVAQIVLDESVLPDYFSDGDAMKITSFRYFSPAGSTTDTVGVIPHLLVDPNLADEVAVLLSASSPMGDTQGMLRVDFGWRWYIDLDQALSDDYQEAFIALLEALPSTIRVLKGTGGVDGWEQTSAAALAEEYGLTGYQSRGFSDSDTSRFGEQIDLLATYGIVYGSGDGTFDPKGELTRAQLCALLAQALNCNVPTGESLFSDVSMEDWYGLGVNAIARLGLVEGVGGGCFDPDAPVTHEQFITIMARLAQRLNMYMDQAMESWDEAAGWTELDGYADWAKDSAWLLALSQRDLLGNTVSLLWDPLEDIDPTAVTTREEAAALVYSLLSYLDILPV